MYKFLTFVLGLLLVATHAGREHPGSGRRGGHGGQSSSSSNGGGGRGGGRPGSQNDDSSPGRGNGNGNGNGNGSGKGKGPFTTTTEEPDDRCAVNTRYDYIVVGAGTAGSLLAAKLAEGDPTSTVLLLEEGGWSNQWDIIDSAITYPETLREHQLSRQVISEPEPNFNDRTIRVPRGKVTGGCSSNNGMVYYLCGRNDLDVRWGVDGWYWDDVRSYWEEIDNNYRYTVVDTPDATWMSKFIDAALEQGYTYTDTPNDLDNLDPATAYTSIRIQSSIIEANDYGKRISSYTEFIESILPKDNLDILVYSRVNKILTRERGNGAIRAIGVEVYNIGDESTMNYYARKEVIITAGVFEAPKLLMLSGIGDCEYLESMGIECLVDVPGVGQNFRDDVYTYMESPPFTNPNFDDIEFPVYANSVFALYGTVNIGENNDYYCGVDVAGTDGEEVFIEINMQAFQMAAKGEVLLQDTDPASGVLLNGNWLGGAGDEERYIYVFRRCRALMYSSVFLPYYTDEDDEGVPGIDVQTDEEILEYARDNADGGWHVGGTCKMGELDDDAMAVVNPRLQVRGVERLRVADASIMPEMVAGHPNQMIMIIAAKAADMILQDN